MSALLLAIVDYDFSKWERCFIALAPERDLRVWPARIGAPGDIRYACAWNAPPGLLASFPNLRAIFSLGAGVDHLAGDPTLPDVPIVRVVDPDLTVRMTEYVVLQVLMHHRRQRRYDIQQRDRVWRDIDNQPAATDVKVGIMGLGVLGLSAARALRHLGFQVAGWSRSRKPLPGIATFAGEGELDAFLAASEILVCLLPSTPDTQAILDLGLLRKLKRDGALRGAYLINAGRGALQVDADILAALDEGSLAGASLDVFPVEPLAPDSPFWTDPRVIVTPHNAATVTPMALARHVLRQIGRLESGQPLENVVDRTRGY